MAAALHRISREGRTMFVFSGRTAGIRRRLSSIHTAVWWEIDDCKVPKGCDPSSIAGNITDALAKLNVSAPVLFSAYGDMYRIPLNVQHALLDSGVALIHLPPGQKNKMYGCSLHLNQDLVDWTYKKMREPTNSLMIFGDVSSFDVHSFRADGHNFLFASPRGRKMGVEMKSAVWRWPILRAGGPPDWTPQ